MSGGADAYPRSLTPTERRLVEWVLPSASPGYRPYREFVAASSVIGPGRRGEGEIILGKPGDEPDVTSPLPSVVSFGIARADDDEVSVTVREIVEGQMSVEVVGKREDHVAPDARVEPRWTYAEWKPGSPCPQCGLPVRQVSVTAGEEGVVLAICAADRRLWVRDGATGICRPVPVTNYHNELMIHTQTRDPKVALVSSRLFDGLAGFSDADLAAAFVRYNRVRTKVGLHGPAATAAAGRPGPFGRLLASMKKLLKTPGR